MIAISSEPEIAIVIDTILPGNVHGNTSPYPTVVSVIITSHRDDPIPSIYL